jgi:hypothetical protein
MELWTAALAGEARQLLGRDRQAVADLQIVCCLTAIEKHRN